MALEIGSKVKVIIPTIQGDIVDIEYDKTNGALNYLLQWTDSDGSHQRWYTNEELEAV